MNANGLGKGVLVRRRGRKSIKQLRFWEKSENPLSYQTDKALLLFEAGLFVFEWAWLAKVQIEIHRIRNRLTHPPKSYFGNCISATQNPKKTHSSSFF